MRWRTVVTALLVVGMLVMGASWVGFSGRQGLTPVEPASTNAEGIDDLYLFIVTFAVVVFLAVMVPLALILGRYREQGLPREAEGPQIRGNTRLEITWTVAALAGVLVISGYTLYKAGDIRDPAQAADDPAALKIAVEGRQFYWRYVYPDGTIAYDRLRIPVDRETELEVTAPEGDVIHSYWAPALGGKADAIPGETNSLRWLPTRTGTFDGRCAELCGIQHSAMSFDVEVMRRAEFDRWLRQEARAQRGESSQLGQQQFQTVCSKCHFAAPEYAPSIAGNPILADEDQVRQIVTEGRGRMPAVGRDWTETELKALTKYVATLAPPGDDSGN